MCKVENLHFFFKIDFLKTEGDATNDLRIRVQGDILYKNHPVDIAEQKKSFIFLHCVIEFIFIEN